MSSMFNWQVVHGGKTPPPGEAVGPRERLSWGRTIGIGAQHVVAMFGATFVFPVVMGLDPNLAILFSGLCTILFLVIVKNWVPSYLGTSAAFVGAVAAIRGQGGDSADVTGAIMTAGIVLLLVGILVHFAGTRVLRAVLPPAVTGAVVMLIGFNLAPVVAGVYWPQDQWVGLATAVFLVLGAVLFPGFWARIAVFLSLLFGFALSWILDRTVGPVTALVEGEEVVRDRVDLSGFNDAAWFGLPSGTLADGVSVVHGPSFSLTFTLLVLPGVIALIAENTGHVRSIADLTGKDLDPYMGRALGADGLATAIASAFGGSPTTTYAENIGVMSATRIYSTAAYYVAAIFAIILGLCPKFGVVINAIPGGVLGGVTVVLYGMIGLIGAKIWVDNNVDFAKPGNLVPLAVGLIIGIGDVTLRITDSFVLSGIGFGSVLLVILYHLVNRVDKVSEADPETTDPTYT